VCRLLVALLCRKTPLPPAHRDGTRWRRGKGEGKGFAFPFPFIQTFTALAAGLGLIRVHPKGRGGKGDSSGHRISRSPSEHRSARRAYTARIRKKEQRGKRKGEGGRRGEQEQFRIVLHRAARCSCNFTPGMRKGVPGTRLSAVQRRKEKGKKGGERKKGKGGGPTNDVVMFRIPTGSLLFYQRAFISSRGWGRKRRGETFPPVDERGFQR